MNIENIIKDKYNIPENDNLYISSRFYKKDSDERFCLGDEKRAFLTVFHITSQETTGTINFFLLVSPFMGRDDFIIHNDFPFSKD